MRLNTVDGVTEWRGRSSLSRANSSLAYRNAEDTVPSARDRATARATILAGLILVGIAGFALIGIATTIGAVGFWAFRLLG